MVMKLSDAMRKGHEIVPEFGWGTLFHWNETGNIDAACALGKALIGVEEVASLSPFLYIKYWPNLLVVIDYFCPQIDCHCEEGGPISTLRRLIIHLNDFHRWTTDKIADHIEQFEYEC